MPVALKPVALAIDIAKLNHSVIDLALTEFTRDAILVPNSGSISERTPRGLTAKRRGSSFRACGRLT